MTADRNGQPTPDSPAPEEPERAAEEAQADDAPSGEAPAEDAPSAQAPAEDAPSGEAPAEQQPSVGEEQGAAEPRAEEQPGEGAEQEAQEPRAEEQPAGGEAQAPPQPKAPRASEQEGRAEGKGRADPVVPGAHLEVDIVPEGEDPLGRGEQYEDPYALDEEEEVAPAEVEQEAEERDQELLTEPIAAAAIDLAADARYRATGKRKTAIARVTLRPGSGTYLVNGRALEEHFPRTTLQRNIRQPLEAVGFHERMDVVARLHGGGISAQAGALRHGVSRALLEADPNLRGELKRRGFLTRDSRAKERKKAGLKKARKRPQFSKR